jgi:hypothetical protein
LACEIQADDEVQGEEVPGGVGKRQDKIRGSIAKIALQTISMFYGFQREAYLQAFGDVRPS